MKKLMLTLIGAGFLFLECMAQNSAANLPLQKFIDSLYQVDQQVQTDMISAFQNGASFDSIKVLEAIEHATFKRHIPALKEIYKKWGYPTRQMVGGEASSHFFTMIQHSDADVDFQIKMLPLIKKMVNEKQVNGEEYAYLFDRVHINKSGWQRYGTQLDYDKEGNAVPKQLKDRAGVNKRRKALGMETLEEYLQKTTELHRLMNQNH